MQSLVYLFIVIASLSVGAAGYFGLMFTPVEAMLTALGGFTLMLVIVEHTMRRRFESRMQRAVDDLSRLLSTDAQAGQMLSQRIKVLADIEAAPRLDTLEADISVLGTVVRQVAEAVSDLETARTGAGAAAGEDGPEDDRLMAGADAAASVAGPPEPVIPLEMLRQALQEDRLVFHVQPIITLPQRRTHGYDLVPRLVMEDGEFADAPDFMPVRGGEGVIRQIERLAVEEAITIVRRAKTLGEPATLFISLSKPSLTDKNAADKLVAMIDANRAIAQHIVFVIRFADWRTLGPAGRAAADGIAERGGRFSIADASTLRLDFGELAGQSVSSVRVDAGRFVGNPASLTDFHTSDVADYVSRFGLELIVGGVKSEEEVLSVLEDGVKLATGPHIARAAPVRPDTMVRRPGAEPNRQRASGA